VSGNVRIVFIDDSHRYYFFKQHSLSDGITPLTGSHVNAIQVVKVNNLLVSGSNDPINRVPCPISLLVFNTTGHRWLVQHVRRLGGSARTIIQDIGNRGRKA
jgi:hypothetical protein